MPPRRCVLLNSMFPGHNRNVFGGAFGHLKRTPKTKDARTSGKMLKIIEKKSASRKCVQSSSIKWILWKDFMDPSLKFLIAFSITKYHAFRVTKHDLGTLYAKKCFVQLCEGKF